MSKRTNDNGIDLIARWAALGIVAFLFLPPVRQAITGLAFVAAISGLVAVVGVLIYRWLTAYQRIDAEASFAPSPRSSPPTQLTMAELLEKVRTIDWFQFEKIIAMAYQKQGYQVTRRGGANPDGGIDLVIEKDGQRC